MARSLAMRPAYCLKPREHYDVVKVSASSCVICATTGDQPQSGVVDLTINRPGREPRLGESVHPGDSEHGSSPILSCNDHLIAVPHGAQAAEDCWPIPCDVPRDNSRPKCTRCGPSSEPASFRRVLWHLHRSVRLEPKVDQLRLDTNAWYRHGHRVRCRENQSRGLVANVGPIRSCGRPFRGGLGRAGRRRWHALIIGRRSQSGFGSRRSC
jgi:hypothetical protein